MQHSIAANLFSGYSWLLGVVIIWLVAGAYVHLRQRLHRMQQEREERERQQSHVAQAPQAQPRQAEKPKVIDEGIPANLIRKPQPSEEELRKRQEQRQRDRERNRQPVVN